MKSFTGLGKAIEFENDRLWAGGVTGLAAEVASTAKLHDDIVPSSVRAVLELNKTFERMADPLGFGKFGINNIFERSGLAPLFSPRVSELAAATKLHHEFAGMSRFVDDHRRTFEAHETLSGLAAAAAPWREMTKLSETLGIGNAFASQLSRMGRLDRALGGLLGMPAHDAWSAHT